MTQQGILPDFDTIGKKFAEHYYQQFSLDRKNVIPLYHDQAMLSYEEKMAQGTDAIGDVLVNKLSFTNIQHIITKVDVQPTFDMGLIILVTGRLKTDEDHPHAFSETFLVKQINGSFLVVHDIFRLSLHNSM